MACVRGGQEGGGEGWAAGGRLYSLLRLFGLAMSPRNASHKSEYVREPKSWLTNTEVDYRPMPSM